MAVFRWIFRPQSQQPPKAEQLNYNPLHSQKTNSTNIPAGGERAGALLSHTLLPSPSASASHSLAPAACKSQNGLSKKSRYDEGQGRRACKNEHISESTRNSLWRNGAHASSSVLEKGWVVVVVGAL
eukprot:c34532_g1_i1 orf=83-463(+)